MPIYKVTYLFNAGRQGWTETFYGTYGNTEEARTTAIGEVLTARTAMLGLSLTIEAVRLVDVAVPRAGLLHALPFPAPGGPRLARDTAWQALSIRLRSLNDYRRPFLMRGLDDETITVNEQNQYVIRPDLRTKITAWKNAMIRAGFRLRVVMRPPEGNLPVRITAMDFDPDGRLRFTIGAHTILPGSFVRIRGVKGPNCRNPRPYSNVNGVYTVYSVTGTQVSVPLLEDAFPITPQRLTGGVLTTRAIQYYQIIDATYLGVSTKQAGRAFFVPRGRRAGRRRA